MKNNLLLLLFSAILLIAGTSCSTYKKLPSPQEYENFNKGSNVATYVKPKSGWFTGELIAVTPDSLYVLSWVGIVKLSKKDITQVELNIAKTSNNERGLTTWATLLPIFALAHGLGAIFTLPINLIVSIAVIVDSHTPYTISYKNEINWEEIAKFSRFPQGFPETININTIK